jgi:uncharacterized membrane protein YdjX (TVP38/TMEM64 family)
VHRPQINKVILPILIAMAVLGGLLLAWGGGDGLGMIKAWVVWLDDLEARYPVTAAILFLVAHITVAALWLPVEILMMVTAGALFGFVEGVILASFGTSIGATLAFLEARFLLRETVKRRFGRYLAKVDEGMKRDGPFFLFSLRLLPIFPFFLTNVTMALTALPFRTFYWVSQLALLPAVMVYVNAGTQIAKLDSLADIVSPRLLLTLIAVALLPWIGKGLVALFRKARSK